MQPSSRTPSLEPDVDPALALPIPPPHIASSPSPSSSSTRTRSRSSTPAHPAPAPAPTDPRAQIASLAHLNADADAALVANVAYQRALQDAVRRVEAVRARAGALKVRPFLPSRSRTTTERD